MKKLCKFFIVMFSVIVMTGCVKFNASMDIKKDKSMDFTIIYAFDTTYFGDEELLDDSDKEELEDNGFSVSDYVDGSMKGFTISKNIKNIDDVSSIEDTEYSLSGIIDSQDENKYLFKVKKGLFKNTYIANLNFDSSDSSLNDSSDVEDDSTIEDYDYSIEDDDTLNDESEYDIEEYDTFEDETAYDIEDQYDFSGMMDSMDLSFNVTLPYAAISNNATTVSDDGKTLKWELTTDDISSMEFEFELYNMTNIYICIGLIILIIIIIVMIVKRNGKKSVNTRYTDSGDLNRQPAQDDIAQNIGRDVYESSLQSVENTVHSSEYPTQMNQSVQNNSIVSVSDVSQEVQNSVSEDAHSSSLLQTEVSSEVISNSVSHSEILDTNSNFDNLNQ